MKLYRTRAALAAVLALTATSAAAQEMPTPQSLVDRYVEAIGGREKALSFQSRRLTYQINAGGAVIDMEISMRRPNLGVVVMNTPMGEIRSGVNGDVVWAAGMMGAQRLSGAQAEDIRIRTAFDADVLLDVYPQMETTGRETHGGKECWSVRMVTASGSEVARCFDLETGLVVAATQTQQGMRVTALIDRYTEYDGLKYPAHTVASVMGQTAETTLLGVTHEAIPDSVFAVPAEVAAQP